MHQLSQVRAFNVFHDEVIQRPLEGSGFWRMVKLSKVMHGNDVGMVELRQRACFAGKAFGKTR